MLELRVPATLDGCREAHTAIMQRLATSWATADNQMEIDLALEEALANARIHGSKNDDKLEIHCCLAIEVDRIRIVIRDSGPGFDVSSLPSPLSEIGRMRSSGRGVLLMRSMMDEVTFAQNGAEVEMLKLRKLEPGA